MVNEHFPADSGQNNGHDHVLISQAPQGYLCMHCSDVGQVIGMGWLSPRQGNLQSQSQVKLVGINDLDHALKTINLCTMLMLCEVVLSRPKICRVNISSPMQYM